MTDQYQTVLTLPPYSIGHQLKPLPRELVLPVPSGKTPSLNSVLNLMFFNRTDTSLDSLFTRSDPLSFSFPTLHLWSNPKNSLSFFRYTKTLDHPSIRHPTTLLPYKSLLPSVYLSSVQDVPELSQLKIPTTLWYLPKFGPLPSTLKTFYWDHTRSHSYLISLLVCRPPVPFHLCSLTLPRRSLRPSFVPVVKVPSEFFSQKAILLPSTLSRHPLSFSWGPTSFYLESPQEILGKVTSVPSSLISDSLIPIVMYIFYFIVTLPFVSLLLLLPPPGSQFPPTTIPYTHTPDLTMVSLPPKLLRPLT